MMRMTTIASLARESTLNGSKDNLGKENLKRSMISL